MPAVLHLQSKLKPSFSRGVAWIPVLQHHLLPPGRHQQLPLASVLIFIPENRQRWHFPLCDSCDEAHGDGPKCRRSFQLGGEQQLVTVPRLKCQVTALLYYMQAAKD